MQWSVYFQNPMFLEMTRKFLIPKGLNNLVMEYCGVAEGMHILDVGCGTGYFARYLAESNANIMVTGIDCEVDFINNAKAIVNEKGLEGLDFIIGDAVALPFEAHSFDAIVSHTFLTSVKNPIIAMNEMKRVCKPGGSVSSVTAMSLIPQALCMGVYPPQCRWVAPLTELSDRVWHMYCELDPLDNYLNFLKTPELPRFFYESGLTDIRIYPLGKAFSLSDASIAPSDKKEYIMKMYLAKKQKIDAFMTIDARQAYITDNDYRAYVELLGEERDFWLENLQDNSVWQWEGGANLIVSGTLPE